MTKTIELELSDDDLNCTCHGYLQLVVWRTRDVSSEAETEYSFPFHAVERDPDCPVHLDADYRRSDKE
jgi:hypothetical protein